MLGGGREESRSKRKLKKQGRERERGRREADKERREREEIYIEREIWRKMAREQERKKERGKSKDIKMLNDIGNLSAIMLVISR